MSETAAVPIILAATEPASVVRWAEILRECGQPICRELADIPPSAQGGIVVTDRADWPGQSAEKGPGLAGILPAELAVVRIAQEPPADVCLPRDFHPRELQTVCRLLSHVVQLRCHLRTRQEMNHQLLQQALTDPLTELPNRRAWEELLGARLAEAIPAGSRWCLAILDLDHFKAINDTFGHPVGDNVLRVVGQTLRDSLRQRDLVARLGGDEFGLLLQVPSPSVAGMVVERVRVRVAFQVSAAACPPVTASLGYCLSDPAGASSAEAMVSVADFALRRAKQQGRDRSAEGTTPG